MTWESRSRHDDVMLGTNSYKNTIFLTMGWLLSYFGVDWIGQLTVSSRWCILVSKVAVSFVEV